MAKVVLVLIAVAALVLTWKNNLQFMWEREATAPTATLPENIALVRSELSFACPTDSTLHHGMLSCCVH